MAITANGEILSDNEQRNADWKDSLQVGNFEIVRIGSYLVVVEGIERIKQFSVTIGTHSQLIGKGGSTRTTTTDNTQKCLNFILGEPKREYADVAQILAKINEQLTTTKNEVAA